jgi:hypothetical protein
VVSFTLGDIVGGEPLFDTGPKPEHDLNQRVAHFRKLFREAIEAMRRGDYVEAKACMDALQFAFNVAKVVHAEREKQAKDAQAGPR